MLTRERDRGEAKRDEEAEAEDNDRMAAYRGPRLIGLPYDASSSFLRGPAEAPALIRGALWSPAGNSWTETLQDLSGAEGLTDAGDLSLPPTADARDLIENGIAGVIAGGWRPLALGGAKYITQCLSG